MATMVASVAVAVALLAAFGAQAAQGRIVAGYAESVRWAGWVDQQRGVRFDYVSARWRVASVNCRATKRPSYSLDWIGIGGVNENKLEQIGTETDCSGAFDHQPSTAYAMLWWEVLPLPEQYPSNLLHVGDLVDASVSVRSGRATVRLTDMTRHWTFTKSARPSKSNLTLDSADWIAEDPEICPSQHIVLSCPEKPYAHFRKVTFMDARAGSTAGQRGSITDSHWSAIRFGMITDSYRNLAWPSALNASGTSFSVSRTNRPAPAEPQPPV